MRKQKKTIGSQKDIQAAQQALDQMLRAYETGSITSLSQNFDPSMIGLQNMMDNIVIETSRCKQMRINLKDKKTSVGPDLAAIQASWEKRCLLLPDMKPVFETGQSTFLLHRGSQGWKTTGIAGTNLLTSNKIPATLTASSDTTCYDISSLPVPSLLRFNIRVSDPYRKSASSVSVKVTSGSDIENIALNPVIVADTPGVFEVTFVTMNKGAAIPGNGIIEVQNNGTICPIITVQYIGNSITSGAQTLTQTVRLR